MSTLFEKNTPQTRQWIPMTDAEYKKLEIDKPYLVTHENVLTANAYPMNTHDEELKPWYNTKLKQYISYPHREVFIAKWTGEGWSREGVWLFKGKVTAYCEVLEPYIEISDAL